MSKIDKYIENIYKDFDKSDEEVKTLKEEMKAHLHDKVEELKKQGHSEEESIKLALESFGEESKVSDELQDIITRQNWLLKVLRVAAVVLFIAACGLKAGSWYYEYTYVNSGEWKNIIKNTPGGIVDLDIMKKIQNKDTISDDDKEQFTNALNKFNNDNHNALYYLRIEKGTKVFFEYEKEITKDAVIINGGRSTSGEKGWTVHYKTTDYGEAIDDNARDMVWSIERASNNPINRLNKYSLVVSIAFWTIMAVYFLQKNLLRKLPSKLYMVFLIVETCIVFTALTFEDHKDFMMLFIIAFTASNMVYEKIHKIKAIAD